MTDPSSQQLVNPQLGEAAAALPPRQSGVDWAELRERMDAVAQSITAARFRDATSRKSVLEARARELARPLARSRDTHTVDAVIARIGDTLIAFPLEYVVEVVRTRGLTPLPGSTPPATLVIGWRGRIVTVLGMKGTGNGNALAEGARILILGERRGTLGMLVDDVDAVRPVPTGGLHPAPASVFSGAHGAADFIQEITQDAIGMVDVRTLLAEYDL